MSDVRSKLNALTARLPCGTPNSEELASHASALPGNAPGSGRRDDGTSTPGRSPRRGTRRKRFLERMARMNDALRAGGSLEELRELLIAQGVDASAVLASEDYEDLALARVLHRAVHDGDLEAIRELYDREYPKPRRVDVTVDPGAHLRKAMPGSRDDAEAREAEDFYEELAADVGGI